MQKWVGVVKQNVISCYRNKVYKNVFVASI